MVHWTKETMLLQGAPKAYDQTVNDFSVEQFAGDMQKTGAGFVVFTTAHGFQYFPAPLESLDKILPGRTARRDLVADLADALAKRGMKLFLYYHLGTQADSAWTKASGFWDTDTSRFFNNWQAIISEVGERYGENYARGQGVTGYRGAFPTDSHQSKACFPKRRGQVASQLTKLPIS
jgi:alpha-L-fucosidase